MSRFKITGQAYIGDTRIEKIVWALDTKAALRQVAPELEDAGYYMLNIDYLGSAK